MPQTKKGAFIALSTIFLFSLSFSSAFADSRSDDAKMRADALLNGQLSERQQNASESIQTRFPALQQFSTPFLNLSADSHNSTLQSLYIVPGSPFISPTTGRFTSKFGWRDIGSGLEFHSGVDLANLQGTKVNAAAAGVVIFSGEKGTYGNVIMISHKLNNIEYATVYAHLSALNVSVGQQVQQGETIGLMGSTGRSTGSHLHFELHLGDWNGGRTNAIDPVEFIQF